MKRFLSAVMVMVVAMVFLVGCAEKPVQDIDAAKAAVDAVKAAGAEKYAPEALAPVQSKYDEAMAEVQVQEKKFFKSYDKTKQLLGEVKTASTGAVQAVETKKEELKQAAMAAEQAAAADLAAAVAAVSKAPSGKGTTEDIEAMKADVKAMEESMPKVQSDIAAGNYAEATTLAASISEKSKSVTEQVNQAIAALKKAKGSKKGAKK